MRKAFVSYHHRNDQQFKNDLLVMAIRHQLFIDGSVDTGAIDEDLDDETTRRIIRDDYLADTTVTILLLGRETKYRKHVDWELKSSMIDGARNKRSGIVVINLPSIACPYFTCSNGEHSFYPEVQNWVTWTRDQYETLYPFMPDRIIDNLAQNKGGISVTSWDRIAANPNLLRFLVEKAAEGRETRAYDCSRPMREKNSAPRYVRL